MRSAVVAAANALRRLLRFVSTEEVFQATFLHAAELRWKGNLEFNVL